MSEKKDKSKRRKRKTKTTGERLAELSEGVLASVVDATLLVLFLSAEFSFGGKPGPGGVWQAYDKAYEDWDTVNYDSIKSALYRLRRKGLIKLSGRGNTVKAQITKQGRKRLKAKLPFYDEKRIWDKKLYLVTYDVPETQRGDRDLLREYLKTLGCGMLQASVWLTPYDLTDVLRNFIDERDLYGAIIVSCVGNDGNIGQEDIKDLVVRVFRLEELNDRYFDYLDEFEGTKNPSASKAIFGFLSILGDDPQLPFKLLPDDWVGDEAYKLFQEICSITDNGPALPAGRRRS